MNYPSIDMQQPDIMNQDSNIYREVPIVWDGDEGGRDGDPKTMYKIQIDGVWTWFIGNAKYEPDGCQFSVQVSSFGLMRKASAGSTGEQFRAKFTKGISEEIKNRITQFFLGPEQKPFLPFRHPKAKCVGIVFKENWILLI